MLVYGSAEMTKIDNLFMQNEYKSNEQPQIKIKTILLLILLYIYYISVPIGIYMNTLNTL